MIDVLARLIRWMEGDEIDDAHIALRDAIAEIAGLRARLDELRLANRCKWISVAERLPDQTCYVLAWDGQEIVQAVFRKESGSLPYFSSHRVHLSEVTHWQPFLETPKVK